MINSSKKAARTALHANYSYFLLLYVPIIIMIFLLRFGGILGERAIGFIFILMKVFAVGIIWVILEYARRTDLKAIKPSSWDDQLILISRGELFSGAVVLFLMRMMYLVFWSFCFGFMAVVKFCSYSQTYYIYYDAVKNGNEMTFNDAITASRKMMDGHKGEYFLLLLSWIGWWLLEVITIGIAGIYVAPYYQLTMANYYLQLLDAQKTQQPDVAEVANEGNLA